MARFRGRSIAAWLVFSIALSCTASARAAVLEGYPTQMSVAPGDTLDLHVRSAVGAYRLVIARQGRWQVNVADLGAFPGRNFPVPANAWESGCGWPVTARVPIPPDWRPGVYLAKVRAGSATAAIPFVVRANVPGSVAPILVQLSTNTWQAYNRYGGRSLYGAYAPGLTGRAYRLSFSRPYDYYATDGTGQLFLWEAPFIAWLETEGYAYEVCTNEDVHRFPRLLESYRLFVSVGHDEYWTREQFDAVENHVNRGGNAAFLSANTLWWQVRLEDGGRTLVCYKSAALDPLNGIDNTRVTVNWHSPPVLRPPARLVGVYYNGSFGIPSGPFQVADPRHWAFRGVAVEAGQDFGSPMVAYEVDARTADSPPVLDLIARTELPDRDNGGVLRPAEMVYYARVPEYGWPDGSGGQVFAGGTVNFTQGLIEGYNGWTRTVGHRDPVVCAVTRNVLDELGCTLGPVRLATPADGDAVPGPQVLLRWYAATAQRTDMPVEYTVMWWTNAAAPAESTTTTLLSAWVPLPYGATIDWRVVARSECGATSTSETQALHAGAATDAPLEAQVSFEHTSRSVIVRIVLDEPARVTFGVFDARGRRLRFFDLGVQPAGLARCEWDLHDRRGKPVAAGMYFLRGAIDRGVFRLKLPVVR